MDMTHGTGPHHSIPTEVAGRRVADPSYAIMSPDGTGVRLFGTAATAFVDVAPRDHTALIATLVATWAPGPPARNGERS